MNQPSEQLLTNQTKTLALDTPLSTKEIFTKTFKILGESNCRIEKLDNHSFLIYKDIHNVDQILLMASVTYLGNPHPKYKKRRQLKQWEKTILDRPHAHLIGVYFYGEVCEFVEFGKESYINKKMHNSSAHVYTLDLLKGLEYGVFSKIDYKKNRITVVKDSAFKHYIDGGRCDDSNDLLTLVGSFNKEIKWNEWLDGISCITEMRDSHFNQWKQTEWPGFYIEYRFDSFIKSNKLYNDIAKYTGALRKKTCDLDFDIRFTKDKFDGDLKTHALEATSEDIILNDEDNISKSLKENGKIWYIIFNHNTKYDKDIEGHPVSVWRNKLLNKNINSYIDRMKNSINFKNMSVVEINNENKEYLGKFKQGRNSNGNPRNAKFKITNAILKNDNYVIYRY